MPAARQAPTRPNAKPLDLEPLAKALVARHVAVSIPFALRARLLTSSKERETVRRSPRCIAVVGAGASVPVLQRSDELVETIRSQCGVDKDMEREALRKLQRVYGLDPEDFETRLVAISQSPEAAESVRDKISELYKVRHPTLLAYEQLAHLLKHRFLDAIISFNFDELLDQSLEDELSPDEYVRIVSERDCDVEKNADEPDYVPLYVKMHGTASDAESLRFTRESYYSIPRPLVEVVDKLLQVDHCAIANVGFGMASFDFQYLLRQPNSLDVFDLSRDALPEPVRDQIDAERKAAQKRPAEFYLPETRSKRSCHSLLRELLSDIEAKSADFGEGLVHFRSVLRHEAIAQLLGPKSDVARRLEPSLTKGPKPRLDPPAAEHQAAYLEKRAIVELAFAAVKARGLLSIAPLAIDRGGSYYDQYQACNAGNKYHWEELCRMAGLEETTGFPDIFVALDDVCDPGDDPASFKSLRTIDVDKLTHEVLSHVASSPNPRDARTLRRAFDELHEGTEIELHARSDRVCSKAFLNPVTLPTRTALEAYTRDMLRDLHKDEPVQLISETGEWLLEDDVKEALKAVPIEIIVAFPSKLGDLKDEYDNVSYQQTPDPWRHNRHMTIVTDRRGRRRAIYFYRRLRTPYVTPVYLDTPTDVERLRTGFDVIWTDLERSKPHSGVIEAGPGGDAA